MRAMVIKPNTAVQQRSRNVTTPAARHSTGVQSAEGFKRNVIILMFDRLNYVIFSLFYVKCQVLLGEMHFSVSLVGFERLSTYVNSFHMVESH